MANFTWKLQAQVEWNQMSRYQQRRGDSLLHRKHDAVLRLQPNCSRTQLDQQKGIQLRKTSQYQIDLKKPKFTVKSNLDRFDGIFHLKQPPLRRECIDSAIVFSPTKEKPPSKPRSAATDERLSSCELGIRRDFYLVRNMMELISKNPRNLLSWSWFSCWYRAWDGCLEKKADEREWGVSKGADHFYGKV